VKRKLPEWKQHFFFFVCWLLLVASFFFFFWASFGGPSTGVHIRDTDGHEKSGDKPVWETGCIEGGPWVRHLDCQISGGEAPARLGKVPHYAKMAAKSAKQATIGVAV